MIQADVNAEGGIRTFPVFADVVESAIIVISQMQKSVASLCSG
ncbi:MAG: hypothetical protein U0936_18175 [Planctomycetaceae bacterium]